MMRAAVLMYHALYRSEAEYAAIDPEERPYAVSLETFIRHLDLIAAMGFGVRPAGTPGGLSVGDRRQVLISFDDGHASNHQLAMPELARRGWTGLFLITTDFVGRRPGYCSWDQLRDMAREGMLLGSHGRTHRFLDALDDAALHDELAGSAAELERETGVRVDAISFPGGRYDSRSIAIGRSLGWRWFLTSRVGDNRPAAMAEGGLLARIALRDDTSLLALEGLLRGGWTLRRATLAAGAKRALRATLGNRLYHSLYRRVSAA